MQLRITYEDKTTLDVEVPDEKVKDLISAVARGSWWGDDALALYIDGKDVRSIHKRYVASAPQSETDGGWVDMG